MEKLTNFGYLVSKVFYIVEYTGCGLNKGTYCRETVIEAGVVWQVNLLLTCQLLADC